MKRVVECGLFVGVVFAALAWVNATANAIPPYKKSFDNLYMEEGSAMYKALEGKSNCNLCHVGKDRKKRNAYGLALDEFLDRKKDAKETEKHEEALKKVEKMHVDPKDEDSPTFGELIESGKLPVTKEDE